MNEWEYKKRKEAKKRIIPSKKNDIKNTNTNGEKYENNAEETKNDTKVKRNEFGPYAIFVIFLVIVIILMSLYLLFYVQKITIKGNETHKAPEIVAWLEEDPLNANSLYLWGKYTLTKSELPIYIESMDVALKSPWSVEISAKEKRLVGGIKKGDKFTYFDQDGIVMLQSKVILKDVPVVEGIKLDDTELYEPLVVDNKEIFKNLLDVSLLLENSQLQPTQITCKKGATIEVTFGEIVVILGDDEYEDKIVQLTTLLKELEGQSGILHMETFDTNDAIISFERNIDNSLD